VVVVASNKDLAELVKKGVFREDLYYRVHVIHIEIPPLSDRREDIPLLVEHFLGTFNRMHSRDVNGLSPEAFSILMEHDFPGNIRELQNIIEHALVLCHSGVIRPHHLPPYLRREPIRDASNTGGMNLKTVEKMLIREACKHEGIRSLPPGSASTRAPCIVRSGNFVPTFLKDGRSRRS
jgi:transcriptional regulator with PAS, ATPase and Fis domain